MRVIRRRRSKWDAPRRKRRKAGPYKCTRCFALNPRKATLIGLYTWHTDARIYPHTYHIHCNAKLRLDSVLDLRIHYLWHRHTYIEVDMLIYMLIYYIYYIDSPVGRGNHLETEEYPKATRRECNRRSTRPPLYSKGCPKAAANTHKETKGFLHLTIHIYIHIYIRDRYDMEIFYRYTCAPAHT